MGGDFSGKNQDCSKGIYALAGETSLISWLWADQLRSINFLLFVTQYNSLPTLHYSGALVTLKVVPRCVSFTQ